MILSTIATRDMLECHYLEATQPINAVTPPGEKWEKNPLKLTRFLQNISKGILINGKFVFTKKCQVMQKKLVLHYLRGKAQKGKE